MASKNKRTDTDSFRTILGSVVPGRRWHVYFPRRVIWQKWEEIVGRPVASAAHPWYFKDLDCLVIAVSDSIWMQQLSYESVSLVEKINSVLPDRARLSRLKFVVADVDSVRKITKPFDTKRKNRNKKDVHLKGSTSKKLTEKELELLESIQDPELRHHLENILRHLH